MAPRSDAPELAVDELRRKARRRLVGAIVLALAAAVLLPLLLENEPKPLGDDVSIQIPPVDSGKFVNPLSPGVPVEKTGKGSGEAATAPRASSEAGKIDSSASASPSAETSPPPPAEKAPPPPAEKAATQSSSASEAPKPVPETKAAAVAGAKSEPAASEPKAQAKAEASAESGSDSAKTSGAFVVQVAAFSDRYGARSLVAKLKKVGFPAFTETVTTDKGTLHRVRVGPYPSRDVADAARAKLKAAGFAGVVARNA